jgi:oligoribonuclease (3'-5' exoribonuclease)
MFKDGQTNVHDEQRSGWLSVVSVDLVESVNKKISEVSCEFPQISRTVLYEIITVRLSYHKFCARWVPKVLTGANKMQRMASAFTF